MQIRTPAAPAAHIVTGILREPERVFNRPSSGAVQPSFTLASTSAATGEIRLSTDTPNSLPIA